MYIRVRGPRSNRAWDNWANAFRIQIHLLITVNIHFYDWHSLPCSTGERIYSKDTILSSLIDICLTYPWSGFNIN